MRKLYCLIFPFLFIFLSTTVYGMTIEHFSLSPVINGSSNLSILASGDLDGDKKAELIISSQYYDCVTIFENDLQKAIFPTPFTYMKGEISVIATADLNRNGFDELIIGHRSLADYDKDPSIYIVEKRNNEYQIIWESKNLGGISRFFVQEDKIIVYVDNDYPEFQRLYLLTYQSGTYKIIDTLDIEGVPVYLGPLGNLSNTLVICSETSFRAFLYKYGSPVFGISLKNYSLIDVSTNTFKPQKATVNLPKTDIWDFESYDLNQNGQNELIIGVYDEHSTPKVEIYQWVSGEYQLAFTIKTNADPEIPKSLTLCDFDGNRIKEVLTVEGVMIQYINGRYIVTHPFANMQLQFYYGPVHLLACDLTQDRKDEIVVFGGMNTEDFQDYDIYDAYLLVNSQ